MCCILYRNARAYFRYADGVPWKNGGKKIILLKSVKRTELSGTVSNMGICQLAVRCVFIGSRWLPQVCREGVRAVFHVNFLDMCDFIDLLFTQVKIVIMMIKLP